MKIKVSFFFCFVLLCTSLPFCCHATSKNGDPKNDKKKKKAKADEHTNFLCPRAKFFEITYRNYPSANNTASNEIDRNANGQGHLVKAKLRFPVLLKPKFKLIGELNYNRERIYLPESVGMFGNVQFQKLGVAFIGERELDNDRFLLGIFSLSTKSELTSLKNLPAPNSVSTVFAYGKNYDDYNKLAVGVSGSYNLGRVRVSPVLMFNKRINSRNYIDALLPKSITYRHLMSNKFYFFTSIQADKSNYGLLNKTFKDESSLELRRTELGLKLGLEREIHDWLWMSMNVGVTKPINNVIVSQGEPSRRFLGTFNDQFQPVLSVSLFMVIPQKLLSKLGK